MAETKDKWARQHQEAVDFLESIGQKYPPCGYGIGDGWKEPVEAALRKIAAIGIPWELAQVKQKFCQLRIYIDFPGSGKVLPVDFLGKNGGRVDVGMPNESGEVSIWQEGHPDHAKYLQVQELIAEAESVCNTRCESCGAQTEGGAASGWKGCKACKNEEKQEYEKKYPGEKWED